MTKVLLTHSYFLRFDPKQWKTMQPYPPLATLYAAAVLRANGFPVSLFDTMFATSAADLVPALEEYRPDVLVIYDDGFNYLTKMCLTNMREAAFEMIRHAKQRGCKVVISSSDSTDHSQRYLEQGADYIVVGEGEQTLLELCRTLAGKNVPAEEISGLRYMEGGALKQTAKRQNLRELDSLPMPAWDLVDMEAYRSRWTKAHGYFSLNMGTTRGCPFKCNWCAKPIYGNRYNSRSPEHAVAELKMLKAAHGFDHIWFCDDIFGLKPGWVQRFADLLEQEKLQFRFKIQSRVDLLLEEDTIEALARAGAEEIWVGAESGSQKILDAMDKGTTVEQIRQATRLMKTHGIKACFFLQFGYPGETMEDIQSTMDLVFELMPHDIGISVSYPLPGTVFYENVRSQLSEKQNWTDSDELLVMFRSTYSPEFYKKLQRHVHYEFRKRHALRSLANPRNLGDLKKAMSLSYRFPQSWLSRAKMNAYVN